MQKQSFDIQNPMNPMIMPTMADPLFHENPMKKMLKNPYSGTLVFNNLLAINSLYTLMKQNLIMTDNRLSCISNANNGNKENTFNSVLPDNKNSININNSFHYSQPNMNMNMNTNMNTNGYQRSFTGYQKGDKIFNIIKDTNHMKRKIVKIIYEEDYNPQEEYDEAINNDNGQSIEIEDNNEYKLSQMEEEEEENDDNNDYFNTFPSWVNNSIFK